MTLTGINTRFTSVTRQPETTISRKASHFKCSMTAPFPSPPPQKKKKKKKSMCYDAFKVMPYQFKVSKRLRRWQSVTVQALSLTLSNNTINE